MTKFFLENFYIMGYNLKNARKKEHIDNTQRVRLYDRLILGKLRGFVWEMLWESKALISNTIFHTNLIVLKLPTVIK